MAPREMNSKMVVVVVGPFLTHEVFPSIFASFAAQRHETFGMKFLLKFVFAPNVPAKKA